MNTKINLLTALLVFILKTGFSQGDWVSFTKTNPEEPIISLVQSNTQSVEFSVEIPGMFSLDKSVEGTTYQRISLMEQSVIQSIGEPELPVIRQLIAIPECTNVDLTISSQTPISFNNYMVYPAPDYLEVENPDGTVYMEEVFTIDEEIYSTNAFYNGVIAEIKEIGYIREQRIAEILIYPVQFNPVTEQLKAYGNLTISLDFTGASSDVCVNTGIFSNICENTLLNYTMGGIGASVNDRADEPGTVEWITVTNTSGEIDADYLIIAANAFFTGPNPDLLAIAQHRAN